MTDLKSINVSDYNETFSLNKVRIEHIEEKLTFFRREVNSLTEEIDSLEKANQDLITEAEKHYNYYCNNCQKFYGLVDMIRKDLQMPSSLMKNGKNIEVFEELEAFYCPKKHVLRSNNYDDK